MHGTKPRLRVVPREDARPVLLVTSAYSEPKFLNNLGREAYSYRFVYRQFAPLLQRWGRTEEVPGSQAAVDEALARVRREGLDPIHLSFLPLHRMYLAPDTPNIGVPAWEFPDIPASDLGGEPLQNWAARANRAAVLMTHTHFSRQAFLRAGVRTPVHVVQVPVPREYFAVPPWEPGQSVTLDCPGYVFPQPEQRTGLGGRPGLARRVYRGLVKPYLTGRLVRQINLAARAAQAAREVCAAAVDVRPRCQLVPRAALDGVVYGTVFNPADGRKNYQDLLSAYLLALRDCPDALLIAKLVISPELELESLFELFDHYQHMGIRHRCRLMFVTAFLSESQMMELTRGCTYYVNCSRAEGSCLPLQNYLAAGRPAVAPPNTGMADSLHDGCGFLVDSHPEPSCWPQDPDRRLCTTWHRIVWQSLHDQFRASYETARREQRRYQEMAEAGRRHMRGLASSEQVWPQLLAVLETAKEAVVQQGPREETAVRGRRAA